MSNCIDMVKKMFIGSSQCTGPDHNPLLSAETTDYTVYEHALTFFGLSKEESEDRQVLDARYKRLLDSFSSRLNRVGATTILGQRLQLSINKVETAYMTLKKSCIKQITGNESNIAYKASPVSEID